MCSLATRGHEAEMHLFTTYSIYGLYRDLNSVLPWGRMTRGGIGHLNNLTTYLCTE
jgi:hypothetical protein